jgi:hypothetical protein
VVEWGYEEFDKASGGRVVGFGDVGGGGEQGGGGVLWGNSVYEV